LDGTDFNAPMELIESSGGGWNWCLKNRLLPRKKAKGKNLAGRTRILSVECKSMNDESQFGSC
jgi:hypothetical protein